MPTVLIIRHGKSQSNAGMLTEDPASIELTGLGYTEAQCIAQHFEEEQVPAPNIIVTSSYKRTKQTAGLIFALFPGVPVEVWPVQEFTYLSKKEFVYPSGKADRKPLVDVYWEICDPELVDGPGSESFEQFIERVRGVIKSIKETSYNTIVIFSHEQFMRAFQRVTEGKLVTPDEDTMCAFKTELNSDPLQNGAILRSDFDNSQECWEWKLIDTHLMALV
jgi:broad specificity phosphatase PhoE